MRKDKQIVRDAKLAKYLYDTGKETIEQAKETQSKINKLFALLDKLNKKGE